jgi:hypothetical protein
MIPDESKWWRQSANRLSAELMPVALGAVLYNSISEGVFLFATPAFPLEQYQSPTFPSPQSVVVTWTPIVLPGLTTGGLPPRFFPAIGGDGINGELPGFRAMVLVSWLRQGVRYVQIADASQGQVCIANASSVQVSYFCELPTTDPSAFAAFVKLSVIVSPNGGGRVSTARISTSPQNLEVGITGCRIGLGNWTRVDRVWWHIAVTVAAPALIQLDFQDLVGDAVATWRPLFGLAATAGPTPNTLQADYPPGAVQAFMLSTGPVGRCTLSGTIQAEL